MNKIHEWVNSGLLVILFIFTLVGGGNHQSASNLAGVTTGSAFPHGISIGLPANSPTNLALIGAGTCSSVQITAGNTTASTTAVVDCATSVAVASGDIVMLSFATTTVASPQWGATSPKWVILAAKASTTASFITGLVLDQTGGDANLSNSGIASTTYYQVFRAQ